MGGAKTKVQHPILPVTLHYTAISGTNPETSRMKAARGCAGHTRTGPYLGIDSMVSIMENRSTLGDIQVGGRQESAATPD